MWGFKIFGARREQLAALLKQVFAYCMENQKSIYA
jgi:hypothetical protein